jgi:UDP-N-acetylmuramoyl-tripeptide--D-alanyl-D-alanine ligase
LKRKSQPLAISTEGKTIESQLFGEYNYSNIAVAVALGKFFDLNLEQIEEGISGYRPTNNRSQIIHKGTNKITLDAYNANPSSMKASITSFVNNREKKGVVILGDMFELGTQTASAHQEILNLVVETNVEDILVVGKYFFKTQTQDPRVQYFSTLEEIKNFLIQNPFDKSDILIKGSRRMTLETLLEQL